MTHIEMFDLFTQKPAIVSRIVHTRYSLFEW